MKGLNWINRLLGPSKCENDYNLLHENKTKLTDLDEDSLLLIFERLDLSSLLAISQLNDLFRAIAADVYRRKFDHKILRLTEQFITPKLGIYVNDRSNTIEIEEYDVILELFKSFGTVISNVEIQTSQNNREINKHIKSIVKHISENSAGLKEFSLSCHDAYPLEIVNLPFTNVEHLSLNGHHKKLGSKTLHFNDMFPKLRRLNLERARIIHRESIAVPFKYLEHLQLNLMNYYDNSEEYIEQLIKMNLQIRSLSIFQISLKFLQFLSINSPNLEYLEFTSSKSVQHLEFAGEINFKSVKYLEVRSSCREFPRNVTFEQLQKLDLLDMDFNDLPYDWIKFIGKNIHLKRVNVPYWTISDAQLKSLTENVPNLVDASFALRPEVETETIVAFLKENKNLKRLELTYPIDADTIEEEIKKIKSQIENEWILTETNGSFSIERIL